MNQKYDPYINHQTLKASPPSSPPPINEPTLAGKLEESAMRCHDLDSVLCAIAERVFGYQEPCEEKAEGPDLGKATRPYQPHAVEIAATISERLASSVGFARSILQRIGEER